VKTAGKGAAKKHFVVMKGFSIVGELRSSLVEMTVYHQGVVRLAYDCVIEENFQQFVSSFVKTRYEQVEQNLQ